MKYILVLSFFFLPAFAFAEGISSFVADIDLQADGTFTVTETIEYDFGSADRHGIYRTIEKDHPQEATSAWKERYIDIEIQDVSQDGAPAPFDASEGTGEVEIKIGDPDVTITGLHTYVISYEVRGAYSYFDDGSAEIYWNVTGNQWQVPIGSVQANITAQGELIADDRACYAGGYGENSSCDTSVVNDDGSVTFAVQDLGAYEGLTIAVELNGDAAEALVLEKWKWWLIGLLLAPLLLVGVIFFGYRYRTAHKTGNTIIAQYEPYEHYKPMYSGMLLDGNLDPHDITAGIVYLAEQGFLKIKKTDKKVLFLFDVDDYEITLLRPLSEIESTFLRDVMELLFSPTAQPPATMKLSELKKDISKQQKNAVALQKLRTALKKNMQEEGFYQLNDLFWNMVIASILFAVLSFFIGVFIDPALFIILLVVIVVGTLAMILFYERRTRKGYEALDHLKGFKLFLSMTEKERYAFHNAPQKSPEQFMEYLPYAIAFGVEKQWAEVFKDVTIPDPSWYDGGSAGSFSAISLTNSLGSFSTAMAASSTSSSSSSGGSGGGGFSGGGGGGGGGGSW